LESKLLKRTDKGDFLVKILEKEALRLKRENEKIHDRRKKRLVQREYDKLISRIKEIKNPSPALELTRYE